MIPFNESLTYQLINYLLNISPSLNFISQIMSVFYTINKIIYKQAWQTSYSLSHCVTCQEQKKCKWDGGSESKWLHGLAFAPHTSNI